MPITRVEAAPDVDVSANERALEAARALTRLVESITGATHPNDVQDGGISAGADDAMNLLESMAAVGSESQRLQEALADMATHAGLTSARSRVRAYLLQHLGEAVTTYELNGAAGIQESPRRCP